MDNKETNTFTPVYTEAYNKAFAGVSNYISTLNEEQLDSIAYGMFPELKANLIKEETMRSKHKTDKVISKAGTGNSRQLMLDMRVLGMGIVKSMVRFIPSHRSRHTFIEDARDILFSEDGVDSDKLLLLIAEIQLVKGKWADAVFLLTTSLIILAVGLKVGGLL